MAADKLVIHSLIISGALGIGKGTLEVELSKRYRSGTSFYSIKSSSGNVHVVRPTNVGHHEECYGDWVRYGPFHGANVFVLCVAVDCPYSIEQLTELYFVEAHTIVPKAPVIVAGLKADLYQTGIVPSYDSQRLLSRQELQQVADKIGAFAYVQLSCKTGQYLDQLMQVIGDALDYSIAAAGTSPPATTPSRGGITKFFEKLWSSDPKPEDPKVKPEKVGSGSTKTPGVRCTTLEIFGGGTSISPYFSYGHTSAVHKNKVFFFGGVGLQKGLRSSPFILDMSTEKPHWVQTLPVESGAPDLHDTESISPPIMPTECHTGIIPTGTQVVAVGSFPAMCVFAPLVLLFGGTHGGSATNRLLSYDMDTGVWSCLFPHSVKSTTDKFPDACYGASLIRFKTKLFLFGGCLRGTCSCQFFEFDLDSHTWTCIQESKVPPPRYHHNAFTNNGGVMYIFGGLGEDNAKLSDLWAYDLNSRFNGKHTGWKQIAIKGSVRPTPQRGHVGCMIPWSHTFLLCSYSNSNPHSELFELDLGSFSWSQIDFDSSSVAREFHSVTQYGSSLLVSGGMWRRAEGGLLGDAFQLSFPAYVSVVPLLPYETWMYLLSFLQPADLCRLGRTCRDFYLVCGADQLWRPYVEESIRNEKNLRRKFLDVGFVWRNPTPGVLKYIPPYWTEPQRVVYECFLGSACILMGDLSLRAVNSVRPGDFVMTEAYKPHRIQEIRKKKVDKRFRMVFLNGVGLTTGHPVFVHGQWVRSCDIAQPTLLCDYQTNSASNDDYTIYNFVLEGGPLVTDHSVILNGLLVCTLGKNCGEKFRTEHPEADSKYGTGFWAIYTPPTSAIRL
ncbi:hypothetical protein Pelo_3025 [Pelomyxa schiedti]|nr:hypothetical protein Pelo_3025 [Pelomyxa schiedti]